MEPGTERKWSHVIQIQIIDFNLQSIAGRPDKYGRGTL